MKRRLAPMVVLLALAAAQGFASEPATPPSPTESGAKAPFSLKPNAEDVGENIFIGHFGETVRLAYFWAADASMRGPMEVVNFHLSTVDGNLFSPPFQPKPADYTPENFKRLRLMQMLVIPKDVPGGLRSLEKIREAKEKELSATGIPYKLEKHGDYNWPPDTFVVTISTPYPLFQLYTQSDKNFFIVTSGASPYDKHRDDPILANSTADLINSLSTYLNDFRLKIIAEKGFVKDLRIALLPGAAVCAFAALLGFLPKRRNWLGRLRLIGRATFGFTSAWHLLAGPVLFASWRLGLDRTINDASIFMCAGLVMPWICKTVSIRRGGQNPWRVFAWSAIANSIPIFLGYDDMPGFIAGTKSITGSQNFLSLSLALGVVGLLNGVVFGLAHRENEKQDLPGGAS